MEGAAQQTDQPPWRPLTAPRRPSGRARTAPSRRALLIRLVAAAALVVFVVIGVGVLVARQLAEAEAVHDAARTAELLGDLLVEPALSDALLAESDGQPAGGAPSTPATGDGATATGDGATSPGGGATATGDGATATGDAGAAPAPAPTGAAPTPATLAVLDELVRSRVIGNEVVRVKIWNAAGTILYSDEPRLIGETFGLDEEELEVLHEGGVDSEVSDLGAPENRFERDQGTLLEAYHAVATASGDPLLFEAYFRYDQVAVRTSELWTAFSLLSAGSVLALIVLLLPVGRGLFVLVRDAQARRESALLQAVDASSNERMRIAGRLHDGAIQDLTASILALRTATSAAHRSGDDALATRLDDASGALRANLGGLRSLLVDLYPPSLTAAGIRPALDDLATAVRGRGVAVQIVEQPHRPLTPDEARLVFRVVRECLGNVVKHSGASEATVLLGSSVPPNRPDAPAPPVGDDVVVEIVDDGHGFDPALLADGRPDREPGHVGIPLITEAVEAANASLEVSSAPGRGTRWRLTLPPQGATALTPPSAGPTA